MYFLNFPKEFDSAFLTLIITGFLGFALKWLGLDKHQIIISLIYIVLVIAVISILGLIQNHYKVRIIPYVVVDISIMYIWGLFSATLILGIILFFVWFVFKLFKLINFLM